MKYGKEKKTWCGGITWSWKMHLMSFGSLPPSLPSPFWATWSEWKTVTIRTERTTSSGLWGVRSLHVRASLQRNNHGEACLSDGSPSSGDLGCGHLPRMGVRIGGDDAWRVPTQDAGSMDIGSLPSMQPLHMATSITHSGVLSSCQSLRQHEFMRLVLKQKQLCMKITESWLPQDKVHPHFIHNLRFNETDNWQLVHTRLAQQLSPAHLQMRHDPLVFFSWPNWLPDFTTRLCWHMAHLS